MTAQIGDKYTYENKTFTVVEMSSARLFNPRNFGMEPHSNSSACWRGYWCEYAITDDELLLKNFHMFNRNDDYPPLNGVEASPQEFLEFENPRSDKTKSPPIRILSHFGHRIYRNVNMRIPYTGKILLGDDFMREYYVHMGYQSSWAYRQLTELFLKTDCSWKAMTLVISQKRSVMRYKKAYGGEGVEIYVFSIIFKS